MRQQPELPSYQLTPHPIGSKREIWAVTWPLMIGFFSTVFMLFVDRLFLGHYSVTALNAAAMAGTAYFTFLVLPMAIVEITEVLVGRLHGEGEKRHKEVGTAVWQMLIICLAFSPFFFFFAEAFPPIFFPENGVEETSYFRWLMWFGPCQCSVIVLCGFFIGIGQMRVVTIAALISNAANIFLDYLLIFGVASLPPLGVDGAAIATVASWVVQLLILFGVMFRKTHREHYRTHRPSFSLPFLKEGIRVGAPSGAGRAMEVFVHTIFFRVLATVGIEQLFFASVAQTLYIVVSFAIDAQAKGVTAIVSNLLGARETTLFSKVLRSALSLHLLYAAIVLTLFWSCSDLILSIFYCNGEAFAMTDVLSAAFRRTLLAVGLFFLVDGISWIFTGFLTAAKDTRYLFWVMLAWNWGVYLPLLLWLIGFAGYGADLAWAIIVLTTACVASCYAWRYFSGRWLRYNQLQEDPI